MADSSAGAGYNASTRLVTHSQVICSNDGRSRRSSSGATSTQSIQSELDCDEMLADLDAYENELRVGRMSSIHKRKGKPRDVDIPSCNGPMNPIASRKKRSKSITVISPPLELARMGRSSSTSSFLTKGEPIYPAINTSLSTDEEDSIASDFQPLTSARGRSISDHFMCFRSRFSPSYESDDSSRPQSALDDPRPSSRNDSFMPGSFCYTPSKFDDFRHSPRLGGVLSPVYGEYLTQTSIKEESYEDLMLSEPTDMCQSTDTSHMSPAGSNGSVHKALLRTTSRPRAESFQNSFETDCVPILPQVNPQTEVSPSDFTSGCTASTAVSMSAGNTSSRQFAPQAHADSRLESVAVSLNGSFDSLTPIVPANILASPHGASVMPASPGFWETSPSLPPVLPDDEFSRGGTMASCESLFNALSTSPREVNSSRQASSAHQTFSGYYSALNRDLKHVPSHHFTAPPRPPSLYWDRLVGSSYAQEGFASVAAAPAPGVIFGSSSSYAPSHTMQCSAETPVKTQSFCKASSCSYSGALFSTPQSKGCFNPSENDTDLWTDSEAVPDLQLQRFWKLLHSHEK